MRQYQHIQIGHTDNFGTEMARDKMRQHRHMHIGRRNDQLKNAATPADSHWAHSDNLGAEMTS